MQLKGLQSVWHIIVHLFVRTLQNNTSRRIMRSDDKNRSLLEKWIIITKISEPFEMHSLSLFPKLIKFKQIFELFIKPV